MLKNRQYIQQISIILGLALFLLCFAGGVLNAYAETTVTDEVSFAAAINSAETVIVVANDITLTNEYRISRDLTIKSTESATLDWSSAKNKTMFTVVNGANFTLEDIVLDGNGLYATLVKALDATFTMNDGVVLKNVLSDGINRAVTVGAGGNPGAGGTFNMNGGLITGVRLDAAASCYNGTINMSGNASISDNNAYGVGIINATLNMTGSATITNNMSARPGVGVLAGDGGVVNMGLHEGDAPRISGNTSTSYYGAGVYLFESEMNMGFDATVSGNNAETLGGGVALNASSLIMTGNARISGNTTQSGGGGGIFLSNSTASMSGNASVYGNAVMSDDGGGGGIYLQIATSRLTVSGDASISANESAKGAGVYLGAETELQLSGGMVSGNVAEQDGGGIYIDEDAKAVIEGASTIANNVAIHGHGGGVFSGNTTDYLTLSTGDETHFAGNGASVAYTPPENASQLYPHIRFATSSIGDHPLNNYDINLGGTDVLVFHVEYEGNGGAGHGAGPDITPLDEDTILAPDAIGIARMGWTFAGWNTAKDGSGDAYAPGEAVTMNRNLVLYAQWSIDLAWLWVMVAVAILIFVLVSIALQRRRVCRR